MHEIIKFIQAIFLCKSDDKMKIGLSQFKSEVKVEKSQKTLKSNNEVKLSDLMRRSC